MRNADPHTTTPEAQRIPTLIPSFSTTICPVPHFKGDLVLLGVQMRRGVQQHMGITNPFGMHFFLGPTDLSLRPRRPLAHGF